MAKVERIDKQQPTSSNPPTLGQGTPSRESVQQRRDTVERFREMPWQTRNIGAPIQTFVRNLPGVGRYLSDRMSEGAGMTPGDETAIQGYAADNPIPAFGAEMAGRAAPYVLGGPATVPARIGYGAAVEGTDAYSEGQDPIVGAGIGALGSAAASIPGRAVTPNPGMQNVRRETERIFAMERHSPEYRQELNRWLADRVGSQANQANFREQVIRETNNFANMHWHRIHDRVARTDFGINRGGPNIEDIPAWIRGFGAGAGGHMLGADPVVSGVAGLLAGPMARGARRIGRRIDQSRPMQWRQNNDLLGDDAQRFLYGGLMGAGGAAGGTPEELMPNIRPTDAIMSQIRGRQ